MLGSLKLLTPLLFLKIKSREMFLINFGVPSALALIATIVCFLMPLHINVFGDNGLIKSVNSLLAILVGFYIASLTAIAAFAPGPLDEPIAGKPLTLTVRRSGEWEPTTLNRRKFLCLLFGFDALSSLLLYLFGEFSYLFAENVKALTPTICMPYATGAFLFIYLVWLSNLVTTTLLGLHYLSERMHRH